MFGLFHQNNHTWQCLSFAGKRTYRYFFANFNSFVLLCQNTPYRKVCFCSATHTTRTNFTIWHLWYTCARRWNFSTKQNENKPMPDQTLLIYKNWRSWTFGHRLLGLGGAPQLWRFLGVDAANVLPPQRWNASLRWTSHRMMACWCRPQSAQHHVDEHHGSCQPMSHPAMGQALQWCWMRLHLTEASSDAQRTCKLWTPKAK